jgi:hypothetical protein
LQGGERIVVQWILAPTGPSTLPQPSTPRRSGSRPMLARLFERMATAPAMDQAAVADWRRKHAAPMFVATGRIGTTARTRQRARGLRAQVLAALHTANMPGAHLYRSWLPSRLVTSAMARHLPPLVTYPALLNADELAGLLAVPLADVRLPGLTVGGTPALAPISEIPSRGRIVAQSTFPGAERPLALSLPDSLRHLHVIGPESVNLYEALICTYY